MMYYTGEYDDGVVLWYGDIEDDWAQFGIINGQWGWFCNDDKMWYEDNKEYLEESYFEMRVEKDSDYRINRYPDYDTALKMFFNHLQQYNKDNIDMIKTLFGEE